MGSQTDRCSAVGSTLAPSGPECGHRERRERPSPFPWAHPAETNLLVQNQAPASPQAHGQPWGFKKIFLPVHKSPLGSQEVMSVSGGQKTTVESPGILPVAIRLCDSPVSSEEATDRFSAEEAQRVIRRLVMRLVAKNPGTAGVRAGCQRGLQMASRGEGETEK